MDVKWKTIVERAGPTLLVIMIIAYFAGGWDAIPEALVAWGTILLAYMTYLLARTSKDQNNRLIAENVERENRDRKERLLNEIIEWAIDVTSANFGGEIIITPGVSEKIQRRRDSANRLLRCQVLTIKGKELIGPSVLSINKDIADAVMKVVDSIDLVRDINSRGLPFIESQEAKDALKANDSVLEQNIRYLLNTTAKYRTQG